MMALLGNQVSISDNSDMATYGWITHFAHAILAVEVERATINEGF